MSTAQAKRVASSKKPETRNWLTMIIMPSKSAMASRSTAFSASSRLKVQDRSSGLRRRAPCGAIDPQSRRGRELLPHKSKRRQQSWRTSERSRAHGAIAHFAIALGASASKSRVSGIPKKYSRNPEAAIPAKRERRRNSPRERRRDRPRRAKRRTNTLRGYHGALGRLKWPVPRLDPRQ